MSLERGSVTSAAIGAIISGVVFCLGVLVGSVTFSLIALAATLVTGGLGGAATFILAGAFLDHPKRHFSDLLGWLAFVLMAGALGAFLQGTAVGIVAFGREFSPLLTFWVTFAISSEGVTVGVGLFAFGFFRH